MIYFRALTHLLLTPILLLLWSGVPNAYSSLLQSDCNGETIFELGSVSGSMRFSKAPIRT